VPKTVQCVQNSTVKEIKNSNSVKFKVLFTSKRLSASQKGFCTVETSNQSYQTVRVCKPDLLGRMKNYDSIYLSL